MNLSLKSIKYFIVEPARHKINYSPMKMPLNSRGIGMQNYRLFWEGSSQRQKIWISFYRDCKNDVYLRKRERETEGAQSKQRLAYISEMEETIKSLRYEVSLSKNESQRL